MPIAGGVGLVPSLRLSWSLFPLTRDSGREGAHTYYPTGAMGYVKRNYPSGNILTEFAWGEYLIWDVEPLFGCDWAKEMKLPPAFSPPHAPPITRPSPVRP